MASAGKVEIHPEIRKMYEEVQVHLKNIREIQTKRTKFIETRHQLGAQKNENDLVRDELNRLEDGAGVYKLIGPALISQDREDAKSIVEKRLEFINDQVKRVEANINQCDKEEATDSDKVVALQQKMQVRQNQLVAEQQKRGGN